MFQFCKIPLLTAKKANSRSDILPKFEKGKITTTTPSTSYPHDRATLTSPCTIKNPFIPYKALPAHAMLVYGFVSSGQRGWKQSSNLKEFGTFSLAILLCGTECYKARRTIFEFAHGIFIFYEDHTDAHDAHPASSFAAH